MKSSKEKNSKRNPQQIQMPEHDRPGRIMSPPPFELDASWNTQAPKTKSKEEEEILEEGKESGE